MNRAESMYEALKDGQPRTRAEIFRRAGRFFLTNNAASELRQSGVAIEQWYEDGEYVYRVLEGGTGAPPDAPLSVLPSRASVDPAASSLPRVRSHSDGKAEALLMSGRGSLVVPGRTAREPRPEQMNLEMEAR